MKRIFLLPLIALAISCSNDSESDLEPGVPDTEPGVEVASLTYEKDIAPIVSNACLACHGNPIRNSAPTSFDTFQLVKNGAEAMSSRMNNARAPMPASGQLPAATRAKFDQWIKDGKIEK